jgi:hypothetical protein
MDADRSGRKAPKAGLSTQRVDPETVSKIKTINYHLLKSRGIRLSQCDIIRYTVRLAYSHEAEFIDYITDSEKSRENPFGSMVRTSSKTWFP